MRANAKVLWRKIDDFWKLSIKADNQMIVIAVSFLAVAAHLFTVFL